MVASLLPRPSRSPGSPSPERAARAAASRAEAQHDAVLVQRYNDGDDDALAEIMARHREKLFAVALSMLKNHADAEEVVQDTFVRAHRGLTRFRGESSLATWLHHIALNLARNRYWYYQRRRRHDTYSLDSTLNADQPATLASLLASSDAGPMREVLAGEFTELVGRCMQALTAQPREVLTLRNSQHFSYAAIAAKLGISIGTVKSRIGRARSQLRELLTKHSPEFGAGEPLERWFDPVRPTSRLGIAAA